MSLNGGMFGTLSLLFSAFLNLAYAQNSNDCKEVDLRLEMGPLRNQEDSRFCFAYTAADLLSQYLATPILPLDVALTTAQTDFAVQLRLKAGYSIWDAMQVGGWPQTALLAMQNAGGYCPNSTKIKSLADLKSQSQLPPSLCHHKNPFIRPFEVRHTQIWPDQTTALDLRQELQKQLLERRPVGIVFMYGILLNESGDGLHALSIVGQKEDAPTGTCQFLVRDSNGGNCELYKPELRESCQKEKGYLWVSADTLQKTLYSITYIKPVQ